MWARWDTVTYPGGLPFNSRIPDGEYDAIDEYVLAPHGGAARDHHDGKLRHFLHQL